MEKANTMKLVKKWNKILNHPHHAPISDKKKGVVAKMLESQLGYVEKKLDRLDEDMSFGNHVSVSDVNTYDTILIPLLRRVAPDLIALDILGTQPMEKPSQLIFAMRAHHAGNESTNSYPLNSASPMGTRLPYDAQQNSATTTYYEMIVITQVDNVNGTTMFNVGDIIANDWSDGSPTKYGLVLWADKKLNLGSSQSQITLLVERLDSARKSNREVGFVLGNLTDFFTKTDKVVPYTTDPAWTVEPVCTFDLPDEGMYNAVLQNYSGSYATAVAEQMGKEINQMNFSVDKVTVTAKTRILKARYSFEVAEDLKAYHGLDAENELVNILSYEILAEMNREIVDQIKLHSINGGVRPYTYSDVDGRWSQERFRTLYNLINKVANEIAISTRRGNGNFIICSMDVKTALESLDGYELWTDVNTDFNANSAIAYAGTIGGRYKVYVDTFAVSDFAVVGYKGDSEMDAGMFYCPYVPLNMVKAVGQDDFQPRLGFRTRYGLGENPFGANLYYRYVDVSGLSYAYGDGPISVKFENV